MDIKNKTGIDWSQKDMYKGIGREDLRPTNDPTKCPVCGEELTPTTVSQDADNLRIERVLSCQNCD